jgi:hypothetical protein
MAITKRSKLSKRATKASSSRRSQSPSVKETVLGMELVDQPRNAGNGWQDRYDATFMHFHFPMYEAKTRSRKGKEFAAQCTDQYVKLFPSKCKAQFDPSLGENDPIIDKKGWDEWKTKKRGVIRLISWCQGLSLTLQ